MKQLITIIALLIVCPNWAQHNNEFYNNGALVHVQTGAEVHVWGDLHMYQASGNLQNNGLIKVQGNSYSDGLFQQSGTGTYRIENSDVNVGERQFISGSYAVRGLTLSAIGINDGSFYNLELANDQGIVYLVGTDSVADVRNSVDFWAGTVQNRIVTHDIGMTGPITYPANGSNYSAVFGMFNPAVGLGNYINNTITLNGTMSSIDAGYIQGKHRRVLLGAGGDYGFIVGLEPAGPGMQRGVQYIRADLGVNNYGTMTGYFETASSNAFAVQTECSGNTMDYFGGVDHGEWMLRGDPLGLQSGGYDITVWPQDDNFIPGTVWAISKDNSFQGTANQCGPTPIGLFRTGFNGFMTPVSEFDVVSTSSALPIELIDINATGIEDHIDVTWHVASEQNLSHYELERSEDAANFEYVGSLTAAGTTNQPQTYVFNDFDVRYFQNYYYRVKSVDMDGSYEYTPVVYASISKSFNGLDENMIALYPNPSQDNFNLSIYANESLEINLAVYNSLGQIIYLNDLNIQKGNTVLSVPSENWAPAVYNVRITDVNSGKEVYKRFIKD